LAFQNAMEGLTGTHEEIIADQMADAMMEMGTAKTAATARMHMDWCPERSTHLGGCKPVGLWLRADVSFGSAMFPDPAFDAAGRTSPPATKGYLCGRSGRLWLRRPAFINAKAAGRPR
jgi:hypothetical protein